MLGELHRGIFLVPAYPAWLDFGGIAEVSFEPDELGVHEVELAGNVVGTSESHVLANWPLEVPPAESGWLAHHERGPSRCRSSSGSMATSTWHSKFVSTGSIWRAGASSCGASVSDGAAAVERD
jgi:hypothetical protein